jgi:hypothetical protein
VLLALFATVWAAPPTTRALTEGERAAMTGPVWRPECPVPLDALVRVEVDHLRPDGTVARGALVVHADAAPAVVTAFEALRAAGFPIERMEPVEAFGGSDDASMAANNTSGFNCRRVGGTGPWSQHAWGRAVDVNPLWNPYVRRVDGGVLRVEPEAGRAWVDATGPGVFVAGSEAVAAFEGVGWRWGGAWRGATVDRQHFSAYGR